MTKKTCRAFMLNAMYIVHMMKEAQSEIKSRRIQNLMLTLH